MPEGNGHVRCNGHEPPSVCTNATIVALLSLQWITGEARLAVSYDIRLVGCEIVITLYQSQTGKLFYWVRNNCE